jgi:protein-tyrosine phosphatase
LVDIHCHIVPGVDDGAIDLAMSHAMLAVAREQGITAIATTPHYVPGSDDHSTIDLHQARLDSIGETQGIELMLSREVRVNASLIAQSSFRELTYGGKGKYILLELATQEAPSYLEQLLFALRLDNITPIIAHPERNMALLREPRKIVELVVAGAHMQLTTSSISGALGPSIQSVSRAMLENSLVSFVASDAHNLTTRPFTDWAPAIAAMQEIGMGDEGIERICTANPQAVLDSTNLEPIELGNAEEKAFLEMASPGGTLGPAKRKRFFFF